MPNRDRSGAVISPARVVAPINVKRRKIQAVRARARPLPDDDVEFVVFHRRDRGFLRYSAEADGSRR